MTEEGRKEKERGQEHTQWGEVGEGEAVCGVSVTCPGGVGVGAGRDASVCVWACMCGVWAETEAERHSQAKDNALCVCMCVRAHVVGVCVWGLGVHGLFVGGGDRVRMRVCTPCGAGGVCVRVPGVCLGMVQAERDAARRKGRRSVCVCVCVCVCGMHTGRVVCGRAETERRSQAKDNVHGWISPIILLVFSDGIHHLPDQDHSRDM